jgi:hypothetical protein
LLFNFNIFTETERVNTIVKIGAANRLTDKQFLEREIAKWKSSHQRKAMIHGEKYYKGEHDILHRKRTVIGKDGLL